MQLSDYGLKKIESYEGWGKALPDGTCAAYQDKFHGKLDVPTIGFGCTDGVAMGMVWSRAEADAAFRKELAKHEAAVNRMIAVEVSQNQFDAMVSLSYNVGSGAVAKSTLLKKLNKGDAAGAAQEFWRFNKAGGGVVPGLVARRASEAALFLKPDGEPNPHAMPATVTASAAPIARPVVAAVTAATTLAVPSLPLPSVPEAVTKSLENADSWKAIGEHAWSFGQFAVGHPGQLAAVGISLLVVWFAPWLLSKLGVVA